MNALFQVTKYTPNNFQEFCGCHECIFNTSYNDYIFYFFLCIFFLSWRKLGLTENRKGVRESFILRLAMFCNPHKILLGYLIYWFNAWGEQNEYLSLLSPGPYKCRILCNRLHINAESFLRLFCIVLLTLTAAVSREWDSKVSKAIGISGCEVESQ